MRKKLDLLAKIKKISEEKPRGRLLRAVDIESVELKELPKTPELADFELKLEGAEGGAAVLARGRTERLEQILALGENTLKWTASPDANAENFASMIGEGLKEIKTNPPIFGSRFKESSILASHMDGYTFTLASYDVEFDKLVELFAGALEQAEGRLEDTRGEREEREYAYGERLIDLEEERKKLSSEIMEREESLKAREGELAEFRSRLKELSAKEYESAEKDQLIQGMEAKIKKLEEELLERASSVEWLNKVVAAKYDEIEKLRRGAAKIEVEKAAEARAAEPRVIEAKRPEVREAELKRTLLLVEKRTLERLLSSLSDEERGGLREKRYRAKLEDINRRLGTGTR